MILIGFIGPSNIFITILAAKIWHAKLPNFNSHFLRIKQHKCIEVYRTTVVSKMELAFNVAWGPISQIAVPFIDVSSAVQLAVGAYGWWKARERTMSLAEMVCANGGRLAPSTTFNFSRYLSIRESDQLRGIAWFDGRLESVPVPKASTGQSGDAGLSCLRAITTALLVLYDVDSVTVVLAHIIPRRLINYDLEHEPVNASGPFLTTIRQFVAGVAAEEKCNIAKRTLLGKIDEGYKTLFPQSLGSVIIEDFQEIEIPIVIGLLEWILTSPAKRRLPCYPTRSIAGWSMAVALSNMGFEIHASSRLIYTTTDFEELRNEESATVALVICNDFETDYERPTPGVAPAQQPSRSAQIVPIKAIPNVIFQHVRHSSNLIDIGTLCAIWDDAFQNTSQLIGPARVDIKGTTNTTGRRPRGPHTTLLEPIVHTETGISTDIDASQGDDVRGRIASGLFQVIGPQLRKYLPAYKWTAATLQDTVFQYWLQQGIWHIPNPEDRDKCPILVNDWYIFCAIALSTVFAVCSKSLVPEGKAAGQSSAFIEVAIYPDLISSPDRRVGLHNLICDLRDALSPREFQLLSLNRWIRMVFNVCTGEAIQSVHCIKDGTIGFHANGVFVIMDIALHPSLQPNSLIKFHTGFGQPLQIPVSDRGFVVTYVGNRGLSKRHTKIDTSVLPALQTTTRQPLEHKIRIDLEPYWEIEPRQVVFRARVDGVVKCTFSPLQLIDECMTLAQEDEGRLHLVNCECQCRSDQVEVLMAQKWKKLEISQLLNICGSRPTTLFGNEVLYPAQLQDGSSDLLYVDVGDDNSMAVLVCVCFRATPKVLAIDCVSCAYQHWNNKVRTAKTRWTKDYELGAILIDGSKREYA